MPKTNDPEEVMVIVADCSVGGPFGGITTRPETAQEKASRMVMVNANAARRAKEDQKAADQQDAISQIRDKAKTDPTAPISADLVAKALGL